MPYMPGEIGRRSPLVTHVTRVRDSESGAVVKVLNVRVRQIGRPTVLLGLSREECIELETRSRALAEPPDKR
jgi:hypothetical protein